MNEAEWKRGYFSSPEVRLNRCDNLWVARDQHDNDLNIGC